MLILSRKIKTRRLYYLMVVTAILMVLLPIEIVFLKFDKLESAYSYSRYPANIRYYNMHGDVAMVVGEGEMEYTFFHYDDGWKVHNPYVNQQMSSRFAELPGLENQPLLIMAQIDQAVYIEIAEISVLGGQVPPIESVQDSEGNEFNLYTQTQGTVETNQFYIVIDSIPPGYYLVIDNVPINLN